MNVMTRGRYVKCVSLLAGCIWMAGCGGNSFQGDTDQRSSQVYYEIGSQAYYYEHVFRLWRYEHKDLTQLFSVSSRNHSGSGLKPYPSMNRQRRENSFGRVRHYLDQMKRYLDPVASSALETYRAEYQTIEQQAKKNGNKKAIERRLVQLGINIKNHLNPSAVSFQSSKPEAPAPLEEDLVDFSGE